MSIMHYFEPKAQVDLPFTLRYTVTREDTHRPVHCIIMEHRQSRTKEQRRAVRLLQFLAHICRLPVGTHMQLCALSENVVNASLDLRDTLLFDHAPPRMWDQLMDLRISMRMHFAVGSLCAWLQVGVDNPHLSPPLSKTWDPVDVAKCAATELPWLARPRCINEVDSAEDVEGIWDWMKRYDRVDSVRQEPVAANKTFVFRDRPTSNNNNNHDSSSSSSDDAWDFDHHQQSCTRPQCGVCCSNEEEEILTREWPAIPMGYCVTLRSTHPRECLSDNNSTPSPVVCAQAETPASPTRSSMHPREQQAHAWMNTMLRPETPSVNARRAIQFVYYDENGLEFACSDPSKDSDTNEEEEEKVEEEEKRESSSSYKKQTSQKKKKARKKRRVRTKQRIPGYKSAKYAKRNENGELCSTIRSRLSRARKKAREEAERQQQQQQQ